jgi:ABC-type antimicrobial peptide transport system permease subunit
MALGAQPRGLLALVLGQSMRTVSVGFLIGGSAALAVTRLIATQFPGSEGLDMSAFAKSSALLAGVMLVASAIPAMRAAGADPLTSLKDG